MRIGLISDTHGLIRREALAALRGAARIIHAGDIGKAEVLAALRTLAPVTAVRGNNDVGPWADAIRTEEVVQLNGVRVYVLHDVKTLALDPGAAKFGVVVSGHSHRPSIEERAGVLYVNPGSAGPRRFKLPVSVAWLKISGARVHASIEVLNV